MADFVSQNGTNSALIFKYIWDSFKYHMPVWLLLFLTGHLRLFNSTLKDFQTAFEGEILCLFTLTFLGKVDFCKSILVYCSQLYSTVRGRL